MSKTPLSLRSRAAYTRWGMSLGPHGQRPMTAQFASTLCSKKFALSKGLRSSQMKAVQMKQESVHSNGSILVTVLVGCGQILFGNEELAIQCTARSKPITGLRICEYLKRYKLFSSLETFQWFPTKSIKLIPMEDCEQGRLEEGVETHKLKDYEKNWHDRNLTSVIMSGGLKIVDHENQHKFDQACRNLYFDWAHCLKKFPPKEDPLRIMSLMLNYNGHEKPLFEAFVDYQLLFLRKKRNKGVLK
eukprot:Gregarina_sp_Poly_1__8598@NODE_50_length_17596_cov_118_903303_g43_i0_p6_GENE_NODE_50_length_17596_cov_118_903303_g43_i0NODE_50_length_17596_cov_118_903303_g43_i0_p6_ORF_typecomplete_len245_score21_64_NODE_50_length_17596_cov_118_903303_g43_i021802914